MDYLKNVYIFLSNFFHTIVITDILDMAIIAFFIYRGIIFVKKTNTANVAKGIIFLVLALWISSPGMLNLNVVNYLLGGTFEIGLLATVILFQPELRHILERMGSSKITEVFSHQTGTEAMRSVITQTVLAASDMSSTKTGALIVFERDVSLDSYVKTGTVVDSVPVAELLKNIFFPNTPLHDGAVIIRKGRVAGAACMLPLSGNATIDKKLGMRHRAAIGVSERSDAIAVVVSEETGDISVAIDGMIKRKLNEDTLEKLLTAELVPEVEKKKFFGHAGTKSRSGKQDGK